MCAVQSRRTNYTSAHAPPGRSAHMMRAGMRMAPAPVEHILVLIRSSMRLPLPDISWSRLVHVAGQNHHWPSCLPATRPGSYKLCSQARIWHFSESTQPNYSSFVVPAPDSAATGGVLGLEFLRGAPITSRYAARLALESPSNCLR